VVVDWLRGLAVVLMIMAHSFDAWMDPAERHGPGWFLVRHASGLPSRLFLFLAGASSAILFERQLAQGPMSAGAMRAIAARRGLWVLVLAYLFRLQEHVLAGFWGGWRQLFRVDILNCIGASLLLLALVGTPRRGRPRYALPLIVAGILIALGPIVGPARLPGWIPQALGSYIGGQRPMSWFPLFPWGAWALVGLVAGHLWLRVGRDADRRARVFWSTGAIGILLVGTVLLVRAIDPEIIRYPSQLVQQMGPGAFFFRLGVIALLAWLGWLFCRRSEDRLTPLRQLGRTSLLIYWIHVDICYGFGTRSIQQQLSLIEATLAFGLLCVAMFGLSVFKDRVGPVLLARWRIRSGGLAP
jgi:uncharacterized membrane protein